MGESHSQKGRNLTEEQIHRSAVAVAELLYGEISEDHPSWESCVEIAETALLAAHDRG